MYTPIIIPLCFLVMDEAFINIQELRVNDSFEPLPDTIPTEIHNYKSTTDSQWKNDKAPLLLALALKLASLRCNLQHYYG